MKWTKEPPTEPGRYLERRIGADTAWFIRVEAVADGVAYVNRTVNCPGHLERIDRGTGEQWNEWSGPIPEPEDP